MLDKTMIERWVKAKSGKGHLDVGERLSRSLRVRSEHVIVTACRAHIDGATAHVIPENYADVCSNCRRIGRERRAYEAAMPQNIGDLKTA
jgi:hypothetical protein